MKHLQAYPLLRAGVALAQLDEAGLRWFICEARKVLVRLEGQGDKLAARGDLKGNPQPQGE